MYSERSDIVIRSRSITPALSDWWTPLLFSRRLPKRRSCPSVSLLHLPSRAMFGEMPNFTAKFTFHRPRTLSRRVSGLQAPRTLETTACWAHDKLFRGCRGSSLNVGIRVSLRSLRYWRKALPGLRISLSLMLTELPIYMVAVVEIVALPPKLLLSRL